jgi:hypothetical protein
MVEWITAVVMLGVMVLAGLVAGPALVMDLDRAGSPLPPHSTGSLPVMVDWPSLILGPDGHETPSPPKSAGRARWADGTARTVAAVTR